MTNNNGTKLLRNITVFGGFILTVFLTFSGTMMAVGADKTQLKSNTATIKENTEAIRTMEQCYASQTAQIEGLGEQIREIKEQNKQMLDILLNDDY